VADRGQGRGTVIRWEAALGRGLLEVVGRRGECLVDAAALHPGAGGALRAGQVVDVEWEQRGAELRALRVTPREDLQVTLGG
jgi:cold shock CspA family protein